jgi:hypothetical protein
MPAAGRTWGIDLSTSPENCVAVAVEWSGDSAVVTDVRCPLTAPAIVGLIEEHAVEQWAVDVPFGWPDGFVALMADRHDKPLPSAQTPPEAEWNAWRTDVISRRVTEREVLARVGVAPLRASFQPLGATAASWALVEAALAARGVRIDRSGMTGTICETYPRAALRGWGRHTRGKVTLAEIEKLFPFLDVPRGTRGGLRSVDAREALVCALVARARERGLTIAPARGDLAAARREGWIHVSLEPPGDLL